MRLEPLLEGHVDVARPAYFATPSGTRQIFDTRGGHFKGSRLRGDVLANGGDWALDPGDGASRLDIRSTLRTDDGVQIFVEARGVLVVNDVVRKALVEQTPIQYEDTYFMTAVRFEVDPGSTYKWLNHLVAVGESRFGPGFIEYRLYSVEN